MNKAELKIRHKIQIVCSLRNLLNVWALCIGCCFNLVLIYILIYAPLDIEKTGQQFSKEYIRDAVNDLSPMEFRPSLLLFTANQPLAESTKRYSFNMSEVSFGENQNDWNVIDQNKRSDSQNSMNVSLEINADPQLCPSRHVSSGAHK